MLTATKIRPQKFYVTKDTFISVALTKGLNLKFVADYCGTSVAMIEQHDSRFLAARVDDQLALLSTPAVPPAAQNRETATLGGGLLFPAEKPLWGKASPSSASLNTLTSMSLNSAVAWVREMDGLRRALAA